MHFTDTAQLLHLLATYGYGIVLIVVALESAGVPMPGETVLVTAAVYAGAEHGMAIGWVVAAAAAGAILGDNVGFWLGREVGLPMLAKFGRSVGLDARRQKLGQYLFYRYGGAIVFFGRFVAFLRAFAALLAGANRLQPARFFVFNAAGAILWASLYGFGGYLLGAEIHRFAGPFSAIALAGTLVVIFLGWRFYKHHEESLLQEAERAMNEAAVN